MSGKPEAPFDFYEPEEQCHYWYGPEGGYPNGIHQARLFVQHLRGGEASNVGFEVRLTPLGDWKLAHVEQFEHGGSLLRVEKRAHDLWLYLWGLMRIAIIEVSVDEENWVEARRMDFFSKDHAGEEWLVPVPKRKEDVVVARERPHVPGVWKALRVKTLGLREGIPLDP